MRSSPPFSPVLLALLVACASPKDQPPPFESPGPGLIFTFPSSGQLDVPLGARVTVAFSEAIDGSALSSPCSPSGTGGLCLLDGADLVAGTWTVVGDGGQAAEFQPDGKLLPGRAHARHITPHQLRGGGGNFGVVTRFTLRLHPVGPSVLGGVLAWPFDRAEQIMSGYRRLTEAQMKMMASSSRRDYRGRMNGRQLQLN